MFTGYGDLILHYITSSIEWSVMQIALIHAPFLIIKIKEPSNLQNEHNPRMSSTQYLMIY
jgi:hypothetical protein